MTNVHLLAAGHVKHLDVTFKGPRAGDTDAALQDVLQNAGTAGEHSSLGALSQSSSF